MRPGQSWPIILGRHYFSNQNNFMKSLSQKGFTLVELLVVLALIGILSTLTVLALMNARQKTRDAERVSATSQIRAGLELGFAQLASYPKQSGGDLVLGGQGTHVLCEVSGLPKFVDSQSECSGTVFLPSVSVTPTPDDGKCSATQNAYRYKAGSGDTSFQFEFCLGQAPANSGLAGGLNCISQSGISGGACK